MAVDIDTPWPKPERRTEPEHHTAPASLPCLGCITLTTELVAAQNQSYEAGKREAAAILRYSEAESKLVRIKKWALEYCPGPCVGELLELINGEDGS